MFSQMKQCLGGRRMRRADGGSGTGGRFSMLGARPEDRRYKGKGRIVKGAKGDEW